MTPRLRSPTQPSERSHAEPMSMWRNPARSRRSIKAGQSVTYAASFFGAGNAAS